MKTPHYQRISASGQDIITGNDEHAFSQASFQNRACAS
jgi:hypothetical protein